MNTEFLSLVDKLEENVESNDFINVCYDIVEQIEAIENSFEIAEHIFNLFEKYPYEDFGTPGPLVHFLEKFLEKGYKEKLVQSLERCPTIHTIFMLNRIINILDGKEKEYYLNILNRIAKDEKIGSVEREVAIDFLEYQLEK